MPESKKSWRSGLPGFLQFLENNLGHRVQSREEVLGYEVYRVDFSEWKLRFSQITPVIWVSEHDAESMTSRELAQSLVDVARTRGLTERNPIFLLPIPGQAIQEHFKTTLLPFLVLDRPAQQAVMESRRPTSELLDRLSAQLEISLLAPYETSKPVTGSRFFGREFEVRRILQGGNSNFAIMGIRRIGKTSLMRELERRFREQVQESIDTEADRRIQFMDCSAINSPSQFIQEVVRELRPQELSRLSNKQYPIYFPDFLDRMARRYGRPLVFFLDEFDQLLAWHRVDDKLLNAMRAASNMGSARFIIGGFREVMQAFSNLNSPVYNFAHPLLLKEFSREQTAAMIMGPLEKLRVHVERRSEIVNRIYDETAGQPNLIQFYCTILVEQLDRQGSRTITAESLFDVYNNQSFRTYVLSTFLDNTTHLEKAIVFAVLTEYGPNQPFSIEEIDNALKRRGVAMMFSDLDLACRNLELAGILVLRSRRYHFATPVFPRVLDENHDVDYLFRKVLEEESW